MSFQFLNFSSFNIWESTSSSFATRDKPSSFWSPPMNNCSSSYQLLNSPYSIVHGRLPHEQTRISLDEKIKSNEQFCFSSFDKGYDNGTNFLVEGHGAPRQEPKFITRLDTNDSFFPDTQVSYRPARPRRAGSGEIIEFQRHPRTRTTSDVRKLVLFSQFLFTSRRKNVAATTAFNEDDAAKSPEQDLCQVDIQREIPYDGVWKSRYSLQQKYASRKAAWIRSVFLASFVGGGLFAWFLRLPKNLNEAGDDDTNEDEDQDFESMVRSKGEYKGKMKEAKKGKMKAGMKKKGYAGGKNRLDDGSSSG